MRLWLVLLVGFVVAASLSEAARDRKKSRQRQEDSRAQAEEEEFGSALARRLDDKKRDNADKEREEREREREKKEKKEEESSSSEEEDEKEGDEKADNKTIVIPPNGKGKKARRATREAISQWRRTRELRTRRDEALTKAGELNDGAQKPLDAPAAKPKNGTRRFRRERDLVQSLRQQNRLSRRRRDQQLTKATELNSGRQLAVEKTMSDSQPAAPQSPDVVKPVTGEVADEELKPFRKGHAANPANHQQQSSESSEEAGTGEAKLKPFRKGHAANPANHQPAAEAQSRVRRDGDDEEAEKKKAHIRKGLAAHPDNHPKEETAEVGKLKPFRKGHAANPANHQPRERRSEDDDSNSEEEGRERRHAAGEDLKPFRKGHAANPANHQPQQAGQEGQVRGKIHKGHAANPANHKPRERRDSDDEAKAEGEVKLIDKVARRGHAANPANHQAPQEGAQPREYTDEEKHDALVKQAAHKGHMGMKPPKPDRSQE